MPVTVKTFAQHIRDCLPIKCRVEIHNGGQILVYRNKSHAGYGTIVQIMRG